MKALTAILPIISCLCWAVARGDGCHFTKSGYARVARIPAQRAFIAFRDGTETLIVESAFETNSPSAAWVLPLPSVPDTVDRVSPGALKTLSFCVQPEIVHDIAWMAVVPSVILFLLLLHLALLLGRGRGYSVGGGLLKVILIVGALCVFAGMLLPALGRARSTLVAEQQAGVRVHKQIAVGSYKVAVLTADTADALDEWLRTNGFRSLSEEAQRIAAAYITENWCFVVARLVRDAGGLSTPHPLMVRFATSKAIYPMRFTALAKSAPHVEIFVAAEKEATCDRLEREFVDRYAARLYSSEPEGKGPRYFFAGRRFGQDIGHGEVCSLLWDGCVVTKLSGVIASHSMSEDIVLGWKEAEPHRRTWFSHRGARLAGITVFSTGLLILTIASLVRSRRYLEHPRGLRRYAAIVYPRLILGMLVAAVGFYFFCPKIAVTAGTHPVLATYRQLSDVRAEFADLSQSGQLQPAATGPAAVERFHQRLRRLPNRLHGGLMRPEISPGNYTLAVRDDKFVVLVYDHIGCEHTVILSPPAEE